MLRVLSFKKLKYFLLTFSILLGLFLLFNSQFSSAQQVCLPLQGYLVWSGNWEQGRIPMASTSRNVLIASPFYVSGRKVGLNTTNPVYTLQVDGDISGNRLCIENDCRSVWPSGGITGSGSPSQVAFWTGTNNLSGSNNLLWDNNNLTLRVNDNVSANNFLGRINASNVSGGTFGANTGGGNYSFPGNVGIGTTAPTTKLDVNGGTIFRSTAGGTTGHVKILSSPSVAGKGGLLLTQVADYTAGTGAFKLYTTNTGGLSGNLFIAHVNQGTPDAVTNLVTIRAGGNVGIGTTAPTQRLDVIGFVRGSQGLCIGNDCRTSWPEGGSGSGYWVENGGNISNTNRGNVGIGITYPTQKLEVDFGNILVQGTGSFDAPREEAIVYLGDTRNYIKSIYGSGVRIGTYGAGDAITLLQISGNVGIGTTAPTTKLDVRGGIYVSSESESVGGTTLNTVLKVPGATGSPSSRITVYKRLYGGGNVLYIGNNYYGASNGARVREDTTRSGALFMIDQDGSFNFFRVSPAGVEYEDFVISGGKVGIGIATPRAKLEVNGTAKIAEWAEQRLDENGFVRIGSILLQWGRRGFSSGEGEFTINFPIPFNEIYNMQCTVKSSQPWSNYQDTWCQVVSLGRTTSSLAVQWSGDNSINFAHDVFWFAIGR